MNTKQLSLAVGVSYIIIFITAIFANFFVLEAMLANPVGTISDSGMMVRLGIMAFLVAAVFDIVVAWALYELYKDHVLTTLSTFFRLTHAVLMGGAVFALVMIFQLPSGVGIFNQIEIFNTIWLIGLFFFGFHLILLTRIITMPRFISVFLFMAGIMYIVDTTAHFTLQNYHLYADTFLMLVAIPSILGEMAFGLWFLKRGIKG